MGKKQMTFEQWWDKVVSLANIKNCLWCLNLDSPEEYREYYDDGDTPYTCVISERKHG